MDASGDSLSRFHSSASASQYFISLSATAARSRHITSSAANWLFEFMEKAPNNSPQASAPIEAQLTTAYWVVHGLIPNLVVRNLRLRARRPHEIDVTLSSQHCGGSLSSHLGQHRREHTYDHYRRGSFNRLNGRSSNYGLDDPLTKP